MDTNRLYEIYMEELKAIPDMAGKTPTQKAIIEQIVKAKTKKRLEAEEKAESAEAAKWDNLAMQLPSLSIPTNKSRRARVGFS